jgi:hypothetical protein
MLLYCTLLIHGHMKETEERLGNLNLSMTRAVPLSGMLHGTTAAAAALK